MSDPECGNGEKKYLPIVRRAQQQASRHVVPMERLEM